MPIYPHQSALLWPKYQLPPEASSSDVTAFSRSGGPSLTNLNPATRTDRGAWKIELNGILMVDRGRRRTLDAISTYLGGRSGLIAVPIWAFDVNPFLTGDGRTIQDGVTFSDGTTFSDGSTFAASREIIAKTSGVTALSATSIVIDMQNGAADLTGVKFSWMHTAYKTGRALDVTGTLWTVEITPAIRLAIPSGAELNFDDPTCLCRLSSDDGLRRGTNAAGHDTVSVSFDEATDYWSNLAAGLL